MTYTEIIASWVKPTHNYLEVGIFDGSNYNKISCKKKVGVDPAPKWKDESVELVTSDEFFANNKTKFDVVFIDGLHTAEQVRKDITNALEHTKKNALIFLHDIEPVTEWLARPLSEYKYPEAWCGDVWKAFWDLSLHPWEIGTFPVEYGLGCIFKGKERGEAFTSAPRTHTEMLIKNKKIRWN